MLAALLVVAVVAGGVGADCGAKRVEHTETFLSEGIKIRPGDVNNKIYNVSAPTGSFATVDFNAELVYENGDPVPLSDVYLHHWIMFVPCGAARGWAGAAPGAPGVGQGRGNSPPQLHHPRSLWHGERRQGPAHAVDAQCARNRHSRSARPDGLHRVPVCLTPITSILHFLLALRPCKGHVLR
jgi:hypothetical protein